MSSVEEKAAARKAEREKRQQRIKASGTNRLAKITGAAGSKDFKAPPSTDRIPTLQSNSTNSRQDSPANTGSGVGEMPRDDNLIQFLKENGHDPDSFANDPLFSYLAGNSGSQGLSLPSQQQQQQQQHFANTQRKSTHRADTDFIWDIVHFFMSISLGVYAALGNPWNISIAFATLQIALASAKVSLGHANVGLPVASMIAPFLQVLSKSRQRQINLVGGLINTARNAYRDMAIVVFVYGCFSLGGKDFARPLSHFV